MGMILPFGLAFVNKRANFQPLICKIEKKNRNYRVLNFTFFQQTV